MKRSIVFRLMILVAAPALLFIAFSIFIAKTKTTNAPGAASPQSFQGPPGPPSGIKGPNGPPPTQ